MRQTSETSAGPAAGRDHLDALAHLLARSPTWSRHRTTGSMRRPRRESSRPQHFGAGSLHDVQRDPTRIGAAGARACVQRCGRRHALALGDGLFESSDGLRRRRRPGVMFSDPAAYARRQVCTAIRLRQMAVTSRLMSSGVRVMTSELDGVARSLRGDFRRRSACRARGSSSLF